MRPPRTTALPILYGSQTGTAQEVAEFVGRRAARRGFQPLVLAMDEFDIGTLPEQRLIVFVAATTGDGEAPDNMKNFWRFLLRKGLPNTALRDVSFAVFGLGDSSYAKFNAIARKLHARLQQLGAAPLVERGLGDEQSNNGIDGDVDLWLPGLWSALLARHPIPDGCEVDDTPELPPPRCAIRIEPPSGASSPPDRASVPDRLDAPFYRAPLSAYGAGERPAPHIARLECNARVTASDWEQDVRHLRFDVSGSGLWYRAGDVAVVYPCNSGDMRGAAVMLGLDPDARVTGVPEVAAEVTVEELLTRYLDVLGSPRRYFFELLSFFAADEEQREKLLELSSPEGASLMYDYAQRERRTYLEVMAEFASARPPLEYLLTMIPPLKPRQFSIASSLAAHPGKLELCVAMVEYRTPLGRHKKGVCTEWLAGLPVGAHVPMWILRGAMRLPERPEVPIICIGPGTGVAPCRALLEERAALAAGRPLGEPVSVDSPAKRARVEAAAAGSEPSDAPSSKPGAVETGAECGWDPASSLSAEELEHASRTCGESRLFFGCRHREKDFYYASQWSAMRATGLLAGAHIAFSRDSESKVYVQHLLRSPVLRTVVGELIVRGGAHVYVSGSANKMPQEVQEAIEEVVASALGGDAEAASKWVRVMQQRRKYVCEAWS